MDSNDYDGDDWQGVYCDRIRFYEDWGMYSISV